jgi:ubiquitin C-terminal hydrolase
MNSSLQCLLHTEIFIKRFYDEINNSNKKQVSKNFYELCEAINKKNDKMSVSPSNVKSAISSVHRAYSGYSQHDTQEFFRRFLEELNCEMNRVSVKPKYKELETKNKSKIQTNLEYDKYCKQREDSIVTDIFYGQIINIFICLECKYQSYSFEKFLDLPILLDSDSSKLRLEIPDLLNEFFTTERIKWDTPCEECKKKTYHEKIQKISKLPEILIISLQRYNPRSRRKNTSAIDMSQVLNMSNFVDRECESKIK